LPVIAEFCRRVDIRGIVDRACPVRDVAIATHGQVIEVLVANRLTSPRPLVHVAGWAREWAVEEVFGVGPDALNDDRIGRALDAIAPELVRIVGEVGLNAIAAFGIDTSRIHWDMTSVSLFGDYELVENGFATPAHGHPKDRRFDLKQIQAGLGVTGDGGIPVFHRAFDGGAGEIAQVVGAMESLRAMCGPRRFLLVGDTKLISAGNVAAMTAAGVDFIAPASKAYVGHDALRAANDMDLVDADYVAQRDAAKAPADRGSYRVGEDSWTMPNPKRHKGEGPRLRRVFVWSSPVASAAGSTRTPKRCAPDWRWSRPNAASGITSKATSAPTGLANRPSPGASTPPPSKPRPPPTAGTACSPTSTPPKPTPARSSPATKAKKSLSAASAPSKGHSPSHPCSCRTTGASRRCYR